jgi:glutamine cyclotransferase
MDIINSMNKILYVTAFFSFMLVSCNTEKVEENKTEQVDVAEAPKVPQLNYSIENQYPHDITSFTEGLLFQDHKLYESTGGADNLPQTKSLFGEVDLKTGKILVKAELDKTVYFGEGIVFLNGKIYQLTYKNQIAFIYDSKSFKQIGTFNYANREGWGMTTDGKYLIMSDGTSYLTYLDPTNYSVVKTLDVAENGYVVEKLNELEYIKGFIYANIWTTNTIVKIDPKTGDIVGKLDLTALAQDSKSKNPDALEMNGIAYDSLTNKILVTGKLWPNMYEIKFNLN